MSLTVTTASDGPVLVARLSGDLDREADVPLSDLGAALAGSAGLVLDFRSTGFISSSGLALLVRLVQAAESAGARVAVSGLDDHYRDVFEITQLDRFMVVAEDHHAAIAAVRGGDR